MTITLNGSTGIQNVLGSAAAPAESNTTSSNTGMYFPTSTTLGFSTAGTNAVYINASQNVGIGTASPTQKLSVIGSLNVSTGQLIAGATAVYSDGTIGMPSLQWNAFAGAAGGAVQPRPGRCTHAIGDC